MSRSFLTVGLSLVICFARVTAASAQTYRCEDLFQNFATAAKSFRPASSTRDLRGPSVESKFASPGMMGQFLKIVDQDVSTQMRIWVDVATLEGEQEKRANAFFEHLIERGLKIDLPRSDSAEFDNHRQRIILQGSMDLVLAAIRNPIVESIVKIHDVHLPIPRWSFFSDVGPHADHSLWRNHLSEKVKSAEFYKEIRRALMGAPGIQYQITVKVSGIEREKPEFMRFVGHIRDVGITVDEDSLKTHSKILLLSGQVDSILTVVRHPAIKEILRFEESPTAEELAERQALALELREKIKVDLLKDNPVASRIVLAGERPQPNSVQGYRDSETPSLIRIEAAGEKRTTIPHEELTARQYSVFLRNNFGQDFAYISEIQGRSVPVFDGIVLNGTSHEGIANVSLKYSSNLVASPTLAKIVKDVEVRLRQLASKAQMLTNADDWYRAVNNLPPPTFATTPDGYAGYLNFTRFISNLFGMYLGSVTKPRETRVVVDVRDHGYDFFFFKSSLVRTTLHEAFLKSAPENVSMTLIWDERRAVVITSDGVKLFE